MGVCIGVREDDIVFIRILIFKVGFKFFRAAREQGC